MHKISTLPNGLTLITVDIPHLNSITTLVAVGAGSRYETRRNSGISHFLEHMFFKGSRKYPSAEQIANVIDGIGAVNNAATSKEFTYYWIKSAAKHLDLSADILSSMLKESLLSEEEIEKEKGVIVEEMRMRRDNPMSHVFDLYENLQFGDQPLGRDIVGSEKIIHSLTRQDFIDYTNSLYSPKNMVLVFAGGLPKNIDQVAKQYFSDLPNLQSRSFDKYKPKTQTKTEVRVSFKKTDQANLILGVKGYDHNNKKRYATKLLSAILGEGMSSRLFIQVRERRGLAYHVGCDSEEYQDAGYFAVYAGLKLEKVEEGLEVIKTELERTATENVTETELKKAKEMVRGRLAIRTESTNFLAEYFGTNFATDRKIQTFDEYLSHIDTVSIDEIRQVARELFGKRIYNLQVIGPFKTTTSFEKLLARK